MRTVHAECPWEGKSVMVGELGRYLGRVDLALPNGASDR